eukprot:2195504-Amphidinium_carterae.2
MHDKRNLVWPKQQVQRHEQVLRNTKVLELYTVISQRAIDMWITCGSVPASYMDNSTDPRHGNYNFRREVQYAITNFINLYVYNYPEDYAQNAVQFTQQDYYFVVAHTTDKLLEQMTTDMKTQQDETYVDGTHAKTVTTSIRSKPQRRTTWKRNWAGLLRQQHRKVIEDKREYKQTHYHDYSIITTKLGIDEEYIGKIIIEVNQQAEKDKDENNPPEAHKLLIFIIQHYLYKVPYLLQKAGLTPAEGNKIFQYFDHTANCFFTRVNQRPLSMTPLSQMEE